MPSEMPHFKLRLPQALLDRLKARADKTKRTTTSLIVEFIQDGLDRDAALDEYYEQQERQQRVGLESLTEDQFNELVDVIQGIRAKKKPPAKKK